MKRKSLLLRILLGLLGLVLAAATGFIIWGSIAAQPMPEALAALQSDAAVKVESGDWLVFTPQTAPPQTGLIFYPGGRVDARAYAPMARAAAEQGYLVVIPRMPLNLAVFGVDKAADVTAAYPQIQHWAIGGHSLGGSMAANYARRHPQQIAGLVLLASYPADSDSLAGSSLAVVSIYGTLDGLATPEKIDHSRALLPASTRWVSVQGGNHAQFGWYGPQNGDQMAQMPREEQQAQTLQAVLDLLKQINP